jgi:hypothetical protein
MLLLNRHFMPAGGNPESACVGFDETTRLIRNESNLCNVDLVASEFGLVIWFSDDFVRPAFSR